MSEEKITEANKAKFMMEIGLDHAVIAAKEYELDAIRILAAPKIGDLVKALGHGPHKMPVPQKDGTIQVLFASFRKHGHVYETNATDPNAIT